MARALLRREGVKRIATWSAAFAIATYALFACSDPEHPEPIGDAGGDSAPAVDVGLGGSSTGAATNDAGTTSQGGVAAGAAAGTSSTEAGTSSIGGSFANGGTSFGGATSSSGTTSTAGTNSTSGTSFGGTSP